MTTQSLPDGEVVTGPGQYAMTMDHYHSQGCCPGPSFSSTGLRKILLESPADFWCQSSLNPEALEPEDTEAFTFGRAAHALLLGDDDFHAKFAIVPTNAPPQPLASQLRMLEEGRTLTASAEERLGFWLPFKERHQGKAFLKEEELNDIGHIKAALERNPIASVLLDGQPEQSLIWQDEKTGLWLKSRLDVLSGTGDFADLKSTSQKGKGLILRDIWRHGYDMQLGLGTVAVEEVLGIPFTPEAYEGRAALLIFAYKKPPYHITPVEVSFDDLHWARLKCRAAIDRAAECLENDDWPGPVEGVLTATQHPEAVQRLADEQAAGLFPRSYR